MKSIRLLSVILLFSFTCFSFANATVVDLPDVENNGYFFDTITGYTWMDIDNFLGMTISEVETAIEGTNFHIATYEEVQQMIHGSAEFPDPYIWQYDYQNPSSPPVDFVSTFNSLYDSMGGSYWSGNPDDSNTIHYRIIWGMSQPTDAVMQWSHFTYGPEVYDPNYMGWVNTYSYTEVYAMGTFVVDSSSVPIPTSLYLFASGFIGLLGLRRKKLN